MFSCLFFLVVILKRLKLLLNFLCLWLCCQNFLKLLFILLFILDWIFLCIGNESKQRKKFSVPSVNVISSESLAKNLSLSDINGSRSYKKKTWSWCGSVQYLPLFYNLIPMSIKFYIFLINSLANSCLPELWRFVPMIAGFLAFFPIKIRAEILV